MADMTARQFAAALARNGFRAVIGGLWYEDATGRVPGTHYGAVVDSKTFKLLRRVTLAKLIESRRLDIEEPWHTVLRLNDAGQPKMLGRVRGKDEAAALKAAFKKFKVAGAEAQSRVTIGGRG